MNPGKIALAVLGALAALVAAGLVAAGGWLLWVYGTQRTDDGFFTSATAELDADTYALTMSEIDLGAQPGEWFPSGRLATVRLSAEARSETPVFIGIGPEAAVNEYLDGVAHTEVTSITRNGSGFNYQSVEGTAIPALPGEQAFWVASAEGAQTQTMTWDLERGEWTVVIMNADASPGVAVRARGSAMTQLLVPFAVVAMVAGLLLGALAAVFLVIALRQSGLPASAAAAAAITPVGFGAYPVRVEGRLDSHLSRWQWLVKWLLAIPHYIILGVLWIAFGILTIWAGIAILFTGRYPKGVFEFNVGVMRWTWRVGYYSYSALGTDQYPPFTLADADYPARLDVAYPERLSRGLVLVKWWLLAIPHYLIVGLLTSGLVWWSTELNQDGNSALQIGGGLIGILVLIAAIAVAFTGRYPQGLFDLVMGCNRWVYRVLAYVALMRDEYPPFRLDTGGSEPGTTPPPPPAEPMPGIHTTPSNLNRV